MEIRKQIIFQWKILQLLRHFQRIKGTAKSIISWPNIKQITTISFEPKPVTFQDHLMTCLHDLNRLHGAIILYFLGIVFREIIFFSEIVKFCLKFSLKFSFYLFHYVW